MGGQEGGEVRGGAYGELKAGLSTQRAVHGVPSVCDIRKLIQSTRKA